MDYKNIQELIKTVSESQLTSFEIETEGIKIKMEKKEEQVQVERVTVNAPPVQSVINDSLNRESIATNKISEEKIQSNIVNTIEDVAKVVPDESLFVVKSPIVGTMYSSPGDESQNFVKIGSVVKKGDTLCILEAMKLMNEIESEVDGEIVEVLALNEDMVEYGQPLFKIRKK
ncbi:acetyl-CoA carboxylase biotin carboxyl carrier protein [Clostridium tagluense]|uniref:acetyl-CoA carboxylase biotin carboxyl carrier protein n=1 Tax=Clostridium tagluense TaxID=360422 RepID=UPI001CF5DB4D|nr:acetyl-CoA carboxylase biotin carboxyl carrier protein [Clostridium tagluense]MCB2311263.1 acetyl-CoA carboxylase biotin carboxyl carrier protein [Clostridium tagluense]MCB2316095.1 acetyl-CoA carboxylase biotin carboxyl carrier protein [Clostridium tagluense]MCB2320839.1 acetyl-CoA carboxylase biotin carboxyl carrier protein [Clostridium tagluense]MCB2325964.1 acetyl-CoA carboxylase biotin carboxyl carrier protein [Clostridium tagluense]MCB2330579.1 acetyl-CoA carboxylase biotin carboxyl c